MEKKEKDFRMRISPEMKVNIKKYAKIKSWTCSQLVKDAVRVYLAEEKKKDI